MVELLILFLHCDCSITCAVFITAPETGGGPLLLATKALQSRNSEQRVKLNYNTQHVKNRSRTADYSQTVEFHKNIKKLINAAHVLLVFILIIWAELLTHI